MQDLSNVQEVTLSSGIVVRARPVPPMLPTWVASRHPDLRDPPLPVEEVKGVAGTQRAIARPGTDAYEGWMVAKEEVERARDQVREDVAWDYAIVDWKLPGESKFSAVPPKTWKFPALLTDYGIEPSPGKRGRRVDFIKIVIISATKDLEALTGIAFEGIAPLAESEVEAVTESFPAEA